jgi:hypothetical protein
VTPAIAARAIRRRPAYAREVMSARRSNGAVNVHVFMGPTAWDRASHRPPGDRIVVSLDLEHTPADYDYGFLQGLAITLNGIDADLLIARQVAVEIIEQGHAALVALLTGPIDEHARWPHTEFFYGIRDRPHDNSERIEGTAAGNRYCYPV